MVTATTKYEDRVGIYRYGNADEKQTNREFKLDCLNPYVLNFKELKVLTLAADSLTFEQMIIDRFMNASVIDAYEYNEEVYLQGLPKYKQIRKRNRIIHYKNDNIFNAKFGKYDVIDLDLCGSFTINLVNELLAAFQQFEQGFIFLTMTKNVRRSLLVDNIQDYGAESLQEFRDKVFAKYLKKHCGLDEFCKPYEYANKSVSKKAMEMVTFVFTKNIEIKGK
jgi:hypothetical protein